MQKFNALDLITHFDSQFTCPFCKTNCGKTHPLSLIYERRGDDATFSTEDCLRQNPPRGVNNPWDRSIGITYNDVSAIAHILAARNPTISPELFFEGRHDLPYLVNLFGRNGDSKPAPVPTIPLPAPILTPVNSAPLITTPLLPEKIVTPTHPPIETAFTLEYSQTARELLSATNLQCPRCDGTCIGKHPSHLLYNKGNRYTVAACGPITDSDWMPTFLQDKRIPHPQDGSSVLVNTITLEAIASVLAISGTNMTAQEFSDRTNLLRAVNDNKLYNALRDLEESIAFAYNLPNSIA